MSLKAIFTKLFIQKINPTTYATLFQKAAQLGTVKPTTYATLFQKAAQLGTVKPKGWLASNIFKAIERGR